MVIKKKYYDIAQRELEAMQREIAMSSAKCQKQEISLGG